MIIRIAVNELQTGMYLHKLDVFWLKHPLVRNEMLLSDAVQINAIQESGVREVWIDLSRGRAPQVTQPVEQAAVADIPVYVPQSVAA